MNTYTISGVGVDRKGKRYDRSTTQVTVQAPVVSKQTSSFMPVNIFLPADGKSTQELTLLLKDENYQEVDLEVQDIA
ncbi:hypothetical protein M8R50_16795 [Enterobacter bugandensis]|uniref:hypothetical protein n=1 Tax=Enterobacter bugandensis TaxID=881260 RepID=UPI00207626BB|nr:hypothetical protein [Enterobacter bugandensis]MCM7239197.1 hypothetical protein [Enterobacter bugandensis]MCM7319105.1 hypothetical protein [Enterobacter bugandensis]MCM7354568.1 hypothetical protein [Enterobacter bugandensis]